MKIPFSADWPALAVKAEYQAGQLARRSGLTPRHLQRIFRRQFACSPQDWLNRARLAVAPELLLAGMPVKVVATSLGFKQAAHFCRHFKRLHQRTPTEFVVLHRPAAAKVAFR